MISKTTARFRKAFANLPEEIKSIARNKYELWKNNPYHNSLRYRKITNSEQVFPIRISEGYRALGVKKDETMIWFWIGSHSEYVELVRNYNRH